jgi:hypothetical protein
MAAELDRFPVKDLPQRYNITRSVIYNRLEKLGIKPTKDKNQSFIKPEQLKLLDQLDIHLKNGGTTSEFIDQTDNQTDTLDTMTEARTKNIYSDQTDTLDIPDGQARQLVIPELIEQLVTVALETVETKRNGLNDLRDLEEIAANNWLIPTSRLAELLARSRSYFTGKKTINYCGFTLEKVGKQGNETLWKISKQDV